MRRLFLTAALISLLCVAACAAETAPYGIEKRIPWTTSHVIGSPDKAPPYRSVRLFPKLKFKFPLWANAEPGTKNLFVLEHAGGYAGPGTIFRIVDDPDGSTKETLLTIDRIVYGLAFDPDYATNGFIYLGSNGPDAEPVNKMDRVSRFTISRAAPYVCDPKSEAVILEWPSNGHNGADLAFGNDGMLYVTSGDGSSDSDKNDMGQNLSALLSKMLRIDVRHPEAGKTYAIPPDNPFVGREGTRPETWAYGFRNPWRMSFDKQTGQLWVGQNGQDLWEQAYLVKKGANYGWSRNEGSHLFHPNRKVGPDPITMPTVEHHHREARSLTGGVVYHGAKFSDLEGAYIYGDFSTGKIWGVKVVDEKILWHREVANTRLQITGFGVDTSGELLIANHLGAFYSLELSPPDAAHDKFPRKLSETGLFASTKDNTPDPALVPYSVNAPLWSDGALKERFIAVPGDGQIEFTTYRGWDCPDGTVLVKTFSMETSAGRRRIETRLLTRQAGEWAGYSYLWNDAQTDADLVSKDGLDRTYSVKNASGAASELKWHYPSRAECMVCHTRAANWVLGLTELQMNREHDYGGVKDNQLRTLVHIGLLKVNSADHINELRAVVQRRPLMPHAEFLNRAVKLEAALPGVLKSARLDRASMSDAIPFFWSSPRSRHLKALQKIERELLPHFTDSLPKPPGKYRTLADPYDPAQNLDLRARSYLHANCAHCHTESAGGNSLMDLDFKAERGNEHLINATPQHHLFGITNAKLVAPGDPARSVLLHRMHIREAGQMPQLATSIPDEQAVKLIEEWILQMQNQKMQN
ncbi:MAG TPA: PQQ-dependent sugar dehydrogenase [Planctomycetota bacterium]|nr:PQQ-dependent sugar dehydrogenase [Planctomycetota bacterium]